jgi:hypothetical protein
MTATVAEVMVATLKTSGVRRVYGLPGDSLNGFTDALRRDGEIAWEHVRHEEAALTGCAGSCGPSNLHLINGLFDANRSRVPVLAIAAHIPREEIGDGYFQETHPDRLFGECSVYCELVSVPEQLPRVLEMAMRAALARGGVAAVVVPGEVFLADAPAGPNPHPIRATSPIVRPDEESLACLITYELVTSALSRVYALARDDDLLGGMWAVLATIFVLRDSFGKSVAAAVSRMAATFVSFVLCLIYLAFLPFHAWALAVLVGASALAVMLLGRPCDAVTAGITTAVIMVVAAVSPQHAWQQPILRLAGHRRRGRRRRLGRLTGIRVRRFRPARSVPPDPAKVKVDLPERAVVRRPRPGRPHFERDAGLHMGLGNALRHRRH